MQKALELAFRVILKMWHIINAIYEEYCQARLDEMLKLNA
jgi:hypothetical protein